jgi:hypothetical protein
MITAVIGSFIRGATCMPSSAAIGCVVAASGAPMPGWRYRLASPWMSISCTGASATIRRLCHSNPDGLTAT